MSVLAALPYNSVVTVPAVSKDMTLLATVKAQLDITVTTYDTILAGYIQQASSAIVAYCNREFAKETLKDSFRVTNISQLGDKSLLQMSRRPIVSVTPVVENGETLTAADFEILASVGQLQRIDANGEPIAWTAGKTEVTYVAGWTMISELPNDLERICLIFVKSLYLSRKLDTNLKRESVPGVLETEYFYRSADDQTGMPPEVSDALIAGRWVDPVL